MSLKSRVKKLEQELRRTMRPIFCSAAHEDPMREYKNYRRKFPHGPAAIVIMAAKIERERHNRRIM